MHSFLTTNIDKLIIHFVGSSFNQEESRESKEVFDLANADYSYEDLMTFFLSQFDKNEYMSGE